MRRYHLLLALPSALILVGYGGVLMHMTVEPAPAMAVVLEEAPEGQRAIVHSDRPVKMKLDGEAHEFSEEIPNDVEPGLHTVTWSTSYMGKPEKSVSHSYLMGPFGKTGWERHGARLSIAQEALDDGDDHKKGDLATALIPILRGILNEQEKLNRYAGKVSNIQLRIRIVSRHVAIVGIIDFLDQANNTSQLSVGLGLTPRVRRNELSVRQTGRVHAKLTGHAREVARGVGQVKGGGTGLVVGAILAHIFSGGLSTVIIAGGAGVVYGDMEADSRVDRELLEAANAAAKKLIPQMNKALSKFLSRQFALDILHPKLKLRVRPARIRFQAGKAIHLFFDIKIFPQTGSRVVYTSKGPIIYGKRINSIPDMMSNLRVDLSANLFNKLSHTLWRYGLLDDVINNKYSLKSLLKKKNRALLAFDVTEARTTLPPVVSKWSGDRIRINVGGLKLDLESLEPKRPVPPSVSLHGALNLCPELDEKKENLVISVEPEPLLASCGEGTEDAPLVPCFTSFVKYVNEKALSQRGALAFAISLGGKQWNIGLGQGMGKISVSIDPVSVGTHEGESPSIRGDVNLRVEHIDQ